MSDENSIEFWRELALKRDRQNIDQAATIARLEAENAQMRSLISSRPDAPQVFWDENRVALESARQQVAIYNLAIDKAKT